MYLKANEKPFPISSSPTGEKQIYSSLSLTNQLPIATQHLQPRFVSSNVQRALVANTFRFQLGISIRLTSLTETKFRELKMKF